MTSLRGRLAITTATAVALLLAAGATHAQTSSDKPTFPSLGGSPSVLQPSGDPTRIRTPARTALPPSGAYDATVARQQLDRMQRDFQALEQSQQSWERKLSTPERERLQPELLQMERLRDQTRAELRELDAELADDAADRDRLRAKSDALSREIDRLEMRSHELEQK